MKPARRKPPTSSYHSHKTTTLGTPNLNLSNAYTRTLETQATLANTQDPNPDHNFQPPPETRETSQFSYDLAGRSAIFVLHAGVFLESWSEALPILNPQDDNAKLSTRLRLAEECVADCEQERHVMHATVDRLRACLEASETCCKGQLEQLGQVGAFLFGETLIENDAREL